MGKERIIFSQEELNRPSKYIIVVADPVIDTHIIDIEEATDYTKKYNRKAIFVSGKEVMENAGLERVKFVYLNNATKPVVRLADSNGQGFKEVHDFILKKYQNGLVIAHSDTITNDIADRMALNKTNGLDFIVYRQDLMLLSAAEKMRVNFMRIHFNSEFSFSKEYYRNFSEKFGEHTAIGIFTSQYIANAQYNLCQSYFKKYRDQLEDVGANEYIDYKELNSQIAYSVYYDFNANKILGFNTEKLTYYMDLMFNAIENKPMKNRAAEFAAMFADNE